MTSRIAAVAVMAIVVAGSAFAARPSRAELPVDLNFRDWATDGVLSDGGVYAHAVSNVRAVLVGSSEGNLVFDTNANVKTDGGRRLCLNFQSQVGMALRCEDVFVAMRSVNFDGSDDVRSLTYGQSYQKRLAISWADTAAGLQYHLRWNGPDAGHAFITVTCTDPAAVKVGSCRTWTSNADGAAGLYSNPLKGASSDTFVGTVVMNHEIGITAR
jgi:hypothetical protein